MPYYYKGSAYAVIFSSNTHLLGTLYAHRSTETAVPQSPYCQIQGDTFQSVSYFISQQNSVWMTSPSFEKKSIPTVTPLCPDFPFVHSSHSLLLAPPPLFHLLVTSTPQPSDSFILGLLLFLHGLWRQTSCVQIPDLLLTSCVTLGKSLIIFVFQFYPL